MRVHGVIVTREHQRALREAGEPMERRHELLAVGLGEVCSPAGADEEGITGEEKAILGQTQRKAHAARGVAWRVEHLEVPPGAEGDFRAVSKALDRGRFNTALPASLRGS